VNLVPNDYLCKIVADASPVGFTYTDASGSVIFANRAAQRILGLKQDETNEGVVGNHHWTFNDPNWKITDLAGNPFPEEMLPFSVVKRSKKATFGIRHGIEWKDGTRVLLNINSEPVLSDSGEFLGMVSVVEDITEKISTEKELRDSEIRYRQLFENLVSAFALHEIILDEEGNPVDYKFIDVNPAFEKFTGLERRKIAGKSVMEVLPGTEKYWIENYGKVALMGVPFSFSNYSAELGRHYETHAFSPRHGQFAVFFNDVTDRVNMENQLRQSQKLQAVGQLAGGIAHDFNNLLAGIMGYAELAIEEARPGTQIANYMENIFLASQRAAGLVKQILTFSRPAKDSLKPVSLAQVLHEAERFLDVSIPKNIELQVVADETLPKVIADGNKIHEAVVNLVVNAVKALDDSGKVTIELKNYQVQSAFPGKIGMVNPGDYAAIVVKDNGKGIPTEILERIFDPFFTTRDVGEGTGMGLSVVYGIMQSHSGDIVVHSLPGQGAEFTLLFPVAEHEEEESENNETSIKGNTSTPLRILLVDDDGLSLRAAEASLKSLGYLVTAEQSSIKALELFESDPDMWELLITDQTMPGLSGLDLIGKCRSISPGFKAVLCSGYSSRISPTALAKHHVEHFIMKPFSRNDLNAKIKEALQSN